MSMEKKDLVRIVILAAAILCIFLLIGFLRKGLNAAPGKNFFEQNPAYRTVMGTLRNSSLAQERLGTPLEVVEVSELGFTPDGTIIQAGLTLKTPRSGTGKLIVQGEKIESVWYFSKFEFTPSDSVAKGLNLVREGELKTPPVPAKDSTNTTIGTK